MWRGLAEGGDWALWCNLWSHSHRAVRLSIRLAFVCRAHTGTNEHAKGAGQGPSQHLPKKRKGSSSSRLAASCCCGDRIPVLLLPKTCVSLHCTTRKKPFWWCKRHLILVGSRSSPEPGAARGKEEARALNSNRHAPLLCVFLHFA